MINTTYDKSGKKTHTHKLNSISISITDSKATPMSCQSN